MADPIEVAGVVAALSVVSDLARGHPVGEAMRACVLATELARRNGLGPAQVRDVYYTTLLRFAGCTATSHEISSMLGGNDIVVRARGDLVDATRPLEALRFATFLAGLGEGRGRLSVIANLPRVASARTSSARADCEVGAGLTARLGLPKAVQQAVLDGFERFDGKGVPAGKSGSDIAEPARYAAVGYAVVMLDTALGRRGGLESVTRWAGRALDPAIVTVCRKSHDELLAMSDANDLHAAVVGAEPAPPRTFQDEAAFDDALVAFGDATDLKSPWLTGHSRGVAELARSAARHYASVDATLAFRAAALHDLGRVAVPSGVWDRAGPLRVDDWEQVRLHPYHTERVLARSPVLRPLARVAGRHHERSDGSGYPGGLGAAELEDAQRLLAAADVFHALGEARPHRPALSVSDASRTLSQLPLDRHAIRAVLDAAAAPAARLPPAVAGLTERELEILTLLIAGRSERQIASTLFIAPSTVHTHTLHIYEKCAVSSRAGLAMFAMEHGLRPIPR